MRPAKISGPMASRVFLLGACAQRVDAISECDSAMKAAVSRAVTDAGIGHMDLIKIVCMDNDVQRFSLNDTPVFAVNKNASNKSNSLALAQFLIQQGGPDCVLAFGFADEPKKHIFTKKADTFNVLEMEKHFAQSSTHMQDNWPVEHVVYAFILGNEELAQNIRTHADPIEIASNRTDKRMLHALGYSTTEDDHISTATLRRGFATVAEKYQQIRNKANVKRFRQEATATQINSKL